MILLNLLPPCGLLESPADVAEGVVHEPERYEDPDAVEEGEVDPFVQNVVRSEGMRAL